MKKSFLGRTMRLFLCLVFTLSFLGVGVRQASASGEFITTWKTDNPGVSDSDQITIPTTGGGYNYAIDWGDGQSDTGITGNATHTYDDPGTYTVTITGTFPQIYFNNGAGTDSAKILSVEQWGTNPWQSMYAAFSGCSNLVVNAIDTPDLSSVTNTAYMFLNAPAFNTNIDSWDVSNVDTMYGMFQSTALNQPLNSWDVSNVTDFRHMFDNAAAFNQDLSDWDMSSAVLVDGMFYRASSFNQDLSDWDMSSVTTTAGMFQEATSFNQNVGSWDVANVEAMGNMFVDSGLSGTNYDAILTGWASQTLQSNVSLGAGSATYCSGIPARARLVSVYGWTITDGGTTCYTLSYSAENGGSISGTAAQYIENGASGSAVTAVPDRGYAFASWSDGSISRVRRDLDVSGNVSVTARFRLQSGAIMRPIAPPSGENGKPLGFEINEGMSRTNSPALTLSLDVDPTTVSGYAVSLDPTLSDTGIPPYLRTAAFALPEKAGTYTLYLSYFSKTGVRTPVISRTISYTDKNMAELPIEGVFARNLKRGSSGEDVRKLQELLNREGFAIATEGPGSAGNETVFYGASTAFAVRRFQEAHAESILVPVGLTQGTGSFYARTRAVANSLLAGS